MVSMSRNETLTALEIVLHFGDPNETVAKFPKFLASREIPSVDIHNILIEYNGGDDGGIGVVEIETCAAWLLAGRTAELAIGRLAYPVQGPIKSISSILG